MKMAKQINCEDNSDEEGWSYCGKRECVSCGVGDEKKASNDRAFHTGWAIAKMATVWPCPNCGHPNRRDFAKPGQQVIHDVCNNCGEMPTDMPTFIDDGTDDLVSQILGDDFNPDEDTCEGCGGQKTPEHPIYGPDGPENGNCAGELPECDVNRDDRHVSETSFSPGQPIKEFLGQMPEPTDDDDPYDFCNECEEQDPGGWIHQGLCRRCWNKGDTE